MASEIKVDTIVNAGGDNDSGIDLGTNDAVKIKIANAVKAEVDSSGHVKLDTVKGYTSAASISVVGEGGSTTTNLQQGLLKTWVHATQVESESLRDSFNVGSITDNATGDNSYNFTSTMSNDDYAILFAGWRDHDNFYGSAFNQTATGAFKARSYTRGTTNLVDSDTIWAGVAGDLA